MSLTEDTRVRKDSTSRTARAFSARAVPLAAGLGGILAFAVAIEIVVRTGLVDERSVPAPTTLFVKLGTMLTDPTLWASVGQTLQGWLVGLVVTMVIAIPLGILLGTMKPVHRALIGVIEFIRPIPPVALIPVAVLLYGSTGNVVVALVVAGAIWPLMIQVIYGVRDVDPVGRDMARVYGFSTVQELTRVVLPGSLPFIMTGLRLATTIGLVIAISAEFIVGVPGLGAEIMLAYQANDLPKTYALVIVAGVLGMLANYAFRAIESRILHWHPSTREAVQ